MVPSIRCICGWRSVGDIYLDLGDPEWKVIVTAATGWSVLTESPLNTPRGLLPLPEPQPGGDLELLRRFVNVRDHDQWRLLFDSFSAHSDHADHIRYWKSMATEGSGKSVMTKVLRALVDPNVAPARSLGNLHDLALAANNGWLPAFDNLSRIAKPMSDALCRMSTGGASSARTLYENDEETLFEAQRAAVLNGMGLPSLRATSWTALSRLSCRPSTRPTGEMKTSSGRSSKKPSPRFLEPHSTRCRAQSGTSIQLGRGRIGRV